MKESADGWASSSASNGSRLSHYAATAKKELGLTARLRYSPNMRRCSRCKVEKPADREHFSFIASKAKWHPWCKPCCAEDRRRDRAENPERYRAIAGRLDPERIKENQRKRYHADIERHRAWGKKTPEQIAKYNETRRLKRQTDPVYAGRVREQREASRRKHGHKHAEQRREAWKTATPTRRLRSYFTSAICHSLKGTTKGGRSWEAILGYSTAQLRDHLERQFIRGMSWDNYGTWHVDHIIPVATFEFSSPDDDRFKECWALTNLRPLWAKDNMRRPRTRTHLI